MKLFGVMSVLTTVLFAGLAQAHETGVPHEGGAFHPVFGVDHLLLLLAAAVVVGVLLWRSR
ncbi:MAG: HupE/UreJ family protein [Alphaproteobacteria bacterium]|nr:HupE/UreJ family protein [Alphaproteobacteria bacterium]